MKTKVITNSRLDLESYLKQRVNLVESALDSFLPKEKTYPSLIHQAMRYSVLNGGKRIRPILVLASAEACGLPMKKALLPACAVELFHSYSLIHDDLPCLDNDDLRRGKPTCHKKFGEAYALLAGDALLTSGFEVLSQVEDPGLSQKLIRVLSQAIGTLGMIGGQVVDKIAETQEVNLPILDYINVNKTGKLIRASCQAGAIIARASAKQEKALAHFGESLGLAFQVIDDIMDSNGYLKFMSEGEARDKAKELTDKAHKAIQIFGSKGEALNMLASFLLARTY